MFLFDIARLKEELTTLQEKMNQPNFWEKQEEANAVVTEMKRKEKTIEQYTKTQQELVNLEELTDLLLQEYDPESAIEVVKETHHLEKTINKMEIASLFSGKYDKNNAILTLHPGAGGTESQDWVQMLYRMYTKWALANGFQVKELDYLEGEEA